MKQTLILPLAQTSSFSVTVHKSGFFISFIDSKASQVKDQGKQLVLFSRVKIALHTLSSIHTETQLRSFTSVTKEVMCPPCPHKPHATFHCQCLSLSIQSHRRICQPSASTIKDSFHPTPECQGVTKNAQAADSSCPHSCLSKQSYMQG